MSNTKIYLTNSPDETQKLASDLGSGFKGGEFIALYGDLGNGKTSFTQGLAMGLNIKRRIISPTFIIVRSYEMQTGKFYHLDLYRIESANDLINLGIEEIFNDKNNIIVVEWAEKMEKMLPRKRTDVHFKFLEEFKREIKIDKYE